MARRLAIPSKDLQLQLVTKFGAIPAVRVQRLSLSTDIPSTTIDQLGSASHAGDAKDMPTVTLTFSAFDIGVKNFAAMTGTDPNNYPATGVDISKLGEIDAVIYIKDPEINDYVKAIHARRLQISNFTFSYSVDGEATEDYTATGSERRFFSKDVVVEKFTSGTNTFTLSYTPTPLKNGRKAITVLLDGKYLEEVGSSPSTGQYSISGTTLTTGDNRNDTVVVVYQATIPGNNWSDVGDNFPAFPAAIRGKDVRVRISASNLPRVQSVTINGTLNTQPVSEMGNRNMVGYQRQIPEITGSITILDTDNDIIELMMRGSITSDTEFMPGEGCVTSGVPLTIELLDPCDTSASPTVLKTVYLDSIALTGEAYDANVNQNAQITFNWKSLTGHCVVYSGAMP